MGERLENVTPVQLDGKFLAEKVIGHYGYAPDGPGGWRPVCRHACDLDLRPGAALAVRKLVDHFTAEHLPTAHRRDPE